MRIWLVEPFTSNSVYFWHVLNQRLNFGTPHGKKRSMQNFKHIIPLSDPDAPAHNANGTHSQGCQQDPMLYSPSDERCTISLDDPKKHK